MTETMNVNYDMQDLFVDYLIKTTRHFGKATWAYVYTV